MLPGRDAELVQIVDAALADATLRARTGATGENGADASWLACRPGCTPCCHGVFRISMLDAERLKTALGALEVQDSVRATSIRTRARALVAEFAALFPGDASTGVLAEEGPAWDEFANLSVTDAPCPVLDPLSGTCDLYAGRPLTCRIFGPPVQHRGGFGVCELCYVGASDAEIFHGELHLQHVALQQELDREYPATETIIAWAVAGIGRG